jgi:hypothetical protein
MKTNKEKLHVTERSHIPAILLLNKGGEALKWINYEDSAAYYAKDKVLWSLGEHNVVLRGGTNAKTGLQSVLTMNTIIAVDSDISPSKFRKNAPILSNKTLFERDRNICAYCVGSFKRGDLTRDHIHPVSKGGKDTWENVVTACYTCNQWKGDRSLEQADMKLAYLPYQPSFSEFLILQNRKILADQMMFLLSGVSKHSRLHAHNLN